MKNILPLLLLLLPCLAFSQDEDLVYYDYIYDSNLKSVKFHVKGYETSMPIIELKGPSTLVLNFDDLSGDTRDFVYSVQHCDANWNPSRNITEFDYLDGFTEGQIRDYDYSFKVHSSYTHYMLTLPNRDMDFKLSGNYLLKIYDDEDEKHLVLTRRFMIVENLVNVYGKAVRPARVEKITTSQEIDFTVSHESFEIRNPQQELSAVVIQNGRWDNAYAGLKPLFSRKGQELFDYQDKIVFPAGKEFRYIDVRGIRYPDPRILSIGKDPDGKYVSILEKDVKRGSMPYFEWRDINGSFVIENTDEQGRANYTRAGRLPASTFITQLRTEEERDFQTRLANATTTQERTAIYAERQRLLNQRQTEENERERELYGENDSGTKIHNLESEYMDVTLQLSSVGEMPDQDVYIFGGLTDWQIKPEFKMTFNPATNAYVAKLTLKQGYYEYLYAVLPNGKTELDFDETEGNWHETDNYYTILVYYRPFGGRYDQIIGASSFSSRDQ